MTPLGERCGAALTRAHVRPNLACLGEPSAWPTVMPPGIQNSNTVLMKFPDGVQTLRHLCDELCAGGVDPADCAQELALLVSIRLRSAAGLPVIPGPRRQGVWDLLVSHAGTALVTRYQALLHLLSSPMSESSDAVANAGFYANAQTHIHDPQGFELLVHWVDAFLEPTCQAHGQALCELFECLLTKGAGSTAAQAGQPRPWLESLIEFLHPPLSGLVLDPMTGRSGFWVGSKVGVSNGRGSASPSSAVPPSLFMRVQDEACAHRLAWIHGFLRAVAGEREGSSATGAHSSVLGPEASPRTMVSNLALGVPDAIGELQRIVRLLAEGERAIVMLPDEALSAGGRAAVIRRELMNRCRLHTQLRLPQGLPGMEDIATQLLFFQKVSASAMGSTTEVWVYDLRAGGCGNARASENDAGPLDMDFAAFKAAFGADADGLSPRVDEGRAGRMRPFTREWIVQNNADRLDFGGPDEAGSEVSACGSDTLLAASPLMARASVQELTQAFAELDALLGSLAEKTTA